MAESQGHNLRLAANTQLGSYRITRCIGEGGMGTVYEGVHEGLGKRVAIKTLHAGGAHRDELIERFVREGKAIAKIQHPNVVDVFDVAVHEGSPYLVMEYLEGEDLGAQMAQQAPMAPQTIADLLIPVVSALAAAHDAGVVHRDLKPDNIFVTKNKRGALEPKLVDFGISKVEDPQALHLTATNALLGTPYYMSPEQAGNARHVDHRSDIFSLGVILYQCATHELPFKGDSLFKLLGEILHQEPPAPRSLVREIPSDFEAVIARAMKKDPAQRFQSAGELGAALLAFASPRVRMSYEPEFGRSAGVDVPARVSAQRGRTARWAGALLAVLCLAAVLLWLKQNRAPEAARANASAKLKAAPAPANAQRPNPPASSHAPNVPTQPAPAAALAAEAQPAAAVAQPPPQRAAELDDAPAAAAGAVASSTSVKVAMSSQTHAARKAEKRPPRAVSSPAPAARKPAAAPASSAPAVTLAPSEPPARKLAPAPSSEDLLRDRK
jgi:serine/threonine-protein kinase